MPTTRIFALAAALPLMALGPAQAADMGAPASQTSVRQLTVTRTAMVVDCSVRPLIVAPGRRGMGEPGTFYARWDYGVPAGCVGPRR